jgi:hypothetical protein
MSESSAQALHASATDRTGLSDFGDDLYRYAFGEPRRDVGQAPK